MGKSAPAAPDPVATAAAQGGWNSFTAQQQQAMNMVGQNTPYGSLQYDQTGSSTLTDPSGKQITVPQFTATQTLSPSQQAIFDQTQGAQKNIATLANDQSSRLSGLLAKPFEYNPANDATKWAFDLGSQTILPQQQRDTAALDRQLVNRGLRPGTDQYEAEMTRLQQGQSQQLNQLALQGNSQAFQQAAYLRANPFNETSALINGSQITQPGSTFTNTPQSQVAGVDYAGLVNQNYQNQTQQYNAQMGGMFGLGGAIAGGALKYGLPLLAASDRRLKRTIHRIGTILNGLPWYRFNYLWDSDDAPPREGLMSDDVRKIAPHAVVVGSTGFDLVDYAAAVGA